MKLYRCFDADGGLLYVGVSGDVQIRLAQHRTQSHWYEQVVTVTTEDVTEADAFAAERHAIATEHPAHNFQHRLFGTTSTTSYDPTNTQIVGSAAAAQIIGISVGTVKRWALNGRLPTVAKLDGATGGYVFDIDDIAAYMRDDIAERQARLRLALEAWARDPGNNERQVAS